MISICLTKFNNNPWDTLMIKAFKKALSEETSFCTVEQIQGYPKKNYDILLDKLQNNINHQSKNYNFSLSPEIKEMIKKNFVFTEWTF